MSKYKAPARSKSLSPAQLQAVYHHYGSVRKAAEKLGVPKSTFHDIIHGKTKHATLEVEQRIGRGFSKLPPTEKKTIKKEATLMEKFSPEKRISKADFLKALELRKKGGIDAHVLQQIKHGYERGKRAK